MTRLLLLGKTQPRPTRPRAAQWMFSFARSQMRSLVWQVSTVMIPVILFPLVTMVTRKDRAINPGEWLKYGFCICALAERTCFHFTILTLQFYNMGFMYFQILLGAPTAYSFMPFDQFLSEPCVRIHVMHKSVLYFLGQSLVPKGAPLNHPHPALLTLSECLFMAQNTLTIKTPSECSVLCEAWMNINRNWYMFWKFPCFVV